MHRIGFAWLVPLLSALSVLSSGGRSAAQEPLDWSAHRWETRGAVRTEEYLGRQALRFGSGSALLVADAFENGTIEFDVAVDGIRSFVGVAFRLAEDGYEHFYLRPHQTGRFDALQYTPDFHGLSAWQLYPEFNATVEIPRDRWLHVRVEVAGSKLTAWVGGTGRPALEVEGLRRGPGAGGIALISVVPDAAEGQLSNAFADFSVTRNDAEVTWRPLVTPAPSSGFVREWSVSSPLPGPERPIENLAGDAFAGLRWSRIAVDDRGRVNLARLAGIPAGETRGMVYARVRVRSPKDQVVRLDYGFSDQASVFVNRQLVFTGNNTYRSRSQRYLGVMTIDNDALRIPLRKGDNELMFAVIEAFGGWGLTARFPDARDLTVEPYD